MAVIEIYTQPGCPFCVRALQLLKRKKLAYKEIVALPGSPERMEARMRSGGRSSVPQIFVDGKGLGGCDDLMTLDAAGRFDPMVSG